MRRNFSSPGEQIVEDTDITDADIINDLGDLVEDEDDDYHRNSTHPTVVLKHPASASESAPEPTSHNSQGITRDATDSSDKINTLAIPVAADDQHRYSLAARAKAVSAEETRRALPNAETFYSVNTRGTPQPAASSGDLVRDLLKKDKVIPVSKPADIQFGKKVNFKDLFRYAGRNDKIILVFSFFCSICGGALIPLMPIIFSQFAKSFLQVGSNKPVSQVLTKYTLYYVYLAVAEFVVIFLSTFGLTRTGERITRRIREAYLAALLRQDIDYFSNVGVGECTARLTEDINVIQKGISEKISRTIHALSTFTTAFAIAFVLSWRLAAILLWSVAAALIVMSVGVYLSFSNNPKILEANSTASTLVEEATSSIRNVKAMGAESRLAEQFNQVLGEAARWATRQKVQLNVSFAITITVNYLNIALILWQGSRFIARNDASFAGVFIVELVMTQAIYALIGIANHVETFSKALGAAQKVYQTIDRVSDFDATSDKGTKVNPLRGTVKFDNVSFYYPSRPDVPVLSNVDLHFPAGKTTALVGASGSGKSSIVDLILRFFDPQGGHVLIDSVDVHSLNLRWLRRQIGIVNQNPSLFGTTIKENIRYGLIGTEFEHETKERQYLRIIEAAQAANIHQFIMSLPERYESQVGDRGFMLSGGQKQRIAIARALVGAPQILLLDEATSAIDSESEEKIVSLLNLGKAQRTTIVVAHRLSTIRDADNIIVLEKGKVVEQGSHDQLMYLEGAYSKLVKAGESAEMTQKEIARYADRQVSDGTNSSSDSEHRADSASDSRGNTPNSAMSSRGNTSYSPIPFYPGESSQSLNPRGGNNHDVEMDVLGPEGWVRSGQDTPQATKVISDSIWALIRFAVGFNSEELWLNSVGIVCCFFGGAEEAVNAILFGESTISLSLPKGHYAEMLSQIAKWAWIYLGFALVQFILYGGLAVTLGISSERMVRRVKNTCFRSALRQDIAFYDATKSSSSTLVSLLATETTNMCGLSGSTFGNLMVVAATLAMAILIGVGFAWKLALVCTATVPLVLGCGYLSVAFLGHHSAATSAEVLAAANNATEALSDIRTVAILTREGAVLKQYCNELGELEKKSLKTVIKVSLVYALCQSIIFLCMALGFWYGGKLLAEHEYSARQFFIAFTSVIFGARSAGYLFSFADDISKAVKGTQLIKNFLGRPVEIDTWSHAGTPLPQKILGAIQFSRVAFKYPGHDHPVLKKLSLSVMPGEHIAIVGPSGSGKSSLISLLERFYDPISGSIMVDGEDIKNYRLDHYRANISLVSQDVTLYEGTIRDNLILGVDEEPGWPFERELRKAIACANLKEFIDSLPSGIYTMVGSKGTMLSGGQKQRISIARAVLRNPSILLLDEATSALDSESERIVQRALDQASKGRTTITIAHRLNTIRNADCIYFLEDGRIAERGSHDELMRHDGRYAQFVKMQEMVKKAEMTKLAPSTSYVDRTFMSDLTNRL